MRFLAAVGTIGLLALPACGKAAPERRGTAPSLELDRGLSVNEASSLPDSIPGAAEMKEIIRIGTRNTQWTEILQKDIPIEKREQLWRRVDMIGNEPTPDHPTRYNPGVVSDKLNEAFAGAPKGLEDILRSHDPLPERLPAGMTIEKVFPTLRQVYRAYLLASRWLSLYPSHGYYDQRTDDQRPWLKLRNDRRSYEVAAQDWERLTPARRKAWVSDVMSACRTYEQEGCEAHAGLEQHGTSGEATSWFESVLKEGQDNYGRFFKILKTHPAAKAEKEGNLLKIVFPTYGIPQEALSWMQEQISQAWDSDGALAIRLEPLQVEQDHAIEVIWEAGVTPHVDDIAGSRITMDSSIPLWLDYEKAAIEHEFGHIMGFTDCYIEFWDEAGQEFVKYSLDPSNRMCAISGGTLASQRQALIEAYGSISR